MTSGGGGEVDGPFGCAKQPGVGGSPAWCDSRGADGKVGTWATSLVQNGASRAVRQNWSPEETGCGAGAGAAWPEAQTESHRPVRGR